MYQILSHLRDMDNEVKSFLLLNMYLQVAWCVYAIDGENPSETFIDELLSKQSSLFEQLYYFLVVLPTYQKEGRSTTVLSCRVGIITAEMWCLFKKSKYYSTRLESLSYLPQLDVVQKFWKLCEQQLNISDETEDEDANEEYIEDINRDVVMISAAKLVLADTVSKDYLGPEIVSHHVSHGASTTEIIKHLITTLRKNSNSDMAVLFFEAFTRVPIILLMMRVFLCSKLSIIDKRKKVSPKGLTFVRCAVVTTTSLAARSVAMWVNWHTDWLMLEPS